MDTSNFDKCLGCLISPYVDELATQLFSVAGLLEGESQVILRVTGEALQEVLHAKLGRLLLLELNAARVTGKLVAEDPAKRWAEFIEMASQRQFWDDLAGPYPTVLRRIDTVIRNRCMASLRFAQRWAADRAALAELCGQPAGRLLELSLGAGDSHQQGQTVGIVHCEGGRIVYKPRSMAVDVALGAFVRDIAQAHGSAMTIGVPRVLLRGEHGWSEFVAHRYAADEQELRAFYRGIGHWLALMRLLGGNDLHAENLIAHGSCPIVVDCETLFAPRLPVRPSGLGAAVDEANLLVNESVLNVGMLPGRGRGLGWRGVDVSSVGMLPGQQPVLNVPGVVNAGSDQARLGRTTMEMPRSQNHPSPEPALGNYWPEVLSAFDELTATLQRLDAAGTLHHRLQAFEPCRIRFVPRPTEAYAEISRMLWHPVSLHKEGPARDKAFNLLATMAVNFISAPSDPIVINAEIDDLLEGDIPFFTAIAGHGVLDGPRDTRWLKPCNLVEAVLEGWRAADFELERKVIRASLVSAFISDGWYPEDVSILPAQPRVDALELRRRVLAARIVTDMQSAAIRGKDGTAAWIAPIVGANGWSVQPLEDDLYGGTSGVALLLAAYLKEVEAGRADPVAGLDSLLADVLHSLNLLEDWVVKEWKRAGTQKMRPLQPGGYIGLGSQIWTRLTLAAWGMDGGDGVVRACALAEMLPAAAAADEVNDLLTGRSGAIVPLLVLARTTGDTRYLRMACDIGDQLCDRAQQQGTTAHWTHERWPKGIGGFAHGVTGIGWALAWLGRESGQQRYTDMAQAAFAFEDQLYDEDEQNWLDLRDLPVRSVAAWCHGAVGIGLAHLHLDPHLAEPANRQRVRIAAAAAWRAGFGQNHCPCHGDLGAWELLHRAMALGEAPEGLNHEQVLSLILTSIEDHGPVSGIARNTFAPGLLSGLGGVVYQLLRAHPDCDLPSVLTLGGGGL
ncbi:type 2 lanthipeptide synthetase LanM family protein [Chitinimonas viridis]|uniref:Type 2 lanthipeptide synthetase LanM family protein n=1 Tax=Chitinimonas viridis TaxID=664880 RepID=A0ABT8B0G6_9NEIS|nr:type 2 lanthipeptide synthetase LanM family protein [Chitinimonas viridis]MDN3575724.1 type 2 lanthipeptide synthetase LanM family protein [Chitinimonas viridis]